MFAQIDAQNRYLDAKSALAGAVLEEYCKQARAAPNELYALSGCRLVDGNGRLELAEATIIVRRDKIGLILQGSPKLPSEIPVYDCRGLTALPGLIDMHVHLSLDPAASLEDFAFRNSSAEWLLNNGANNAGEALRRGITTVRDLGSKDGAAISLMEQLADQKLCGPSVIAAGRMITARSGHGTQPAFRFGREVQGPKEAAQAVAAELGRGAEVVKLATCSASSTNELTLEELRAACAEAHQLGTKVACHANFSAESITRAIAAGCDTIEHGFVMDKDKLARMSDSGQSYTPTLIVLRRALENAQGFDGQDSEFQAKLREVQASQRESFDLALRTGVRIVAGSDAGLPGIGFDSLHDELELMVEYGMPRAQTLAAATGEAAAALGQEARLGFLRPGACADIVLAAGDPLESLECLRMPRCVIRRGEKAGAIGLQSGTLKTSRPG